jgi:hypothetical protein
MNTYVHDERVKGEGQVKVKVRILHGLVLQQSEGRVLLHIYTYTRIHLPYAIEEQPEGTEGHESTPVDGLFLLHVSA